MGRASGGRKNNENVKKLDQPSCFISLFRASAVVRGADRLLLLYLTKSRRTLAVPPSLSSPWGGVASKITDREGKGGKVSSTRSLQKQEPGGAKEPWSRHGNEFFFRCMNPTRRRLSFEERGSFGEEGGRHDLESATSCTKDKAQILLEARAGGSHIGYCGMGRWLTAKP